MNVLRQLMSYVLLAGMAIPTFSVAMNPIAGIQNAFNNNVDLQFRLGLKKSYDNEEVQAIKDFNLNGLNQVVRTTIGNELARDHVKYRALADRMNAIRTETGLIQNEIASPVTTAVRRDALYARLAQLGLESDEKALETDLYIRMHQLYGFRQLDPVIPAHNAAILAEVCLAHRVNVDEVIFFPTAKTNVNQREYGVAKGFIYPIHSRLSRKVVLINMAQFNTLSASQRKDSISHVLAQFQQQEAQWRVFQKHNRERMLYWAKMLPYIVAACGVVYYWTHGRVDTLPYTTLTDVYSAASDACGQVSVAGSWTQAQFATLGNSLWSWMPSFSAQAPQVVTATTQAAPNQFVLFDKPAIDAACDSVAWLLRKTGTLFTTLGTKSVGPVVTPVMDATYWQQLRELIAYVLTSIEAKAALSQKAVELVARTPYEFKTIGSAIAGSWAVDKLGTQWNKFYNLLESYRADKIVCQKRGEDGLAGVYERSAHDIAHNNGGMTRIAYLWLQKKLGRI